MTGRFQKAPLTIMAMKLHTSELIALDNEQITLLRKKLLQHGLVHSDSADIKFLNLNQTAQSNVEANDTKRFSRLGFFNNNRTEALFYDLDGIEWRVTEYSNFEEFSIKLQAVLANLLEVVEFLPKIHLNAVTLSYADLVVPFENRELKDYFSNQTFLPLDVINPSSPDDEFTSGINQFTRVVNADTQLIILIEQLPYTKETQRKLVPDFFVENDSRFVQNILVKEHWNSGTAKTYGLMLMHATSLSGTTVGESDWSAKLTDLNKLISDQFMSLLNRSVCNEDWEFTEDTSK